MHSTPYLVCVFFILVNRYATELTTAEHLST